MKLTTEILMSYVDDELDAAQRADVETQMAADPQVAQQVQRLRAQRDKLRAAFAGVMEEPVPDRLIHAARKKPAKPARQWSWPEWTAMAACLIAGAFLGQSLMRSGGSTIVATNDGLIAHGALAQALSGQLAADRSPDKPAQVVFSYRNKAGQYCRSFVLQDEAGLAGAACRDREVWRINVLAKNDVADAADKTYRRAGSALPVAVLHAVNAQIQGDTLDAAAESAARRNDWR